MTWRKIVAIAVGISGLGWIALRAGPYLAVEAAVQPAAAAQASGDYDARLRDFLRKRFRIPTEDTIDLGPPSPGPFPGVVTRILRVKTVSGQGVSGTIFTDQTGSKVIIGNLLDLDSDPWGRVEMSKAHLDESAAIGPGNAPVTIVEFADFQCPFCARAFQKVETLVKTTYKGRVRLVYKNFPLSSHPWANQAAIDGECVRMQSPPAFWKLASDLYSRQKSISSDNLQKEVEQFGSKMHLDGGALKACMSNSAAEARIAQDQGDGTALGVTSTPTFFVNGIPIVGLPEAKVLNLVIDSELSAGKGH